MNVRPVPGRSPADCPPGLGQYAALPPLVDGDASDAELLGDLGQPDGLAVVHQATVSKVLTQGQRRTDNQYMDRCEKFVKTGLPDVLCGRRAPYIVIVKAGGSTHCFPSCKTHIGNQVAAWLDLYGNGVTVTVEMGPA